MSSTTFEQFKTPINADWLNDVNRKTYGPPSPDDSSLVGYLPSGTSSVATTVQTKLRESVSVKDFGATGNGTTDDTAAIQAAINYVQSTYILGISTSPWAGSCRLFFPAGYYKLTSELVVSAKIAMEGEGQTEFSTGSRLVQTIANKDTIRINVASLSFSYSIEKLTFVNTIAGTGHHINVAPTGTVYPNSQRIIDCVFANPQQQSLKLIGDDIQVTGNLFDVSGFSGFAIQLGTATAGQVASNVNVSNNNFFNCPTRCIIVYNAYGVVANGNRVSQAVSTDRTATFFDAADASPAVAKRFTITGNTFEGVIRLFEGASVSDVVISGNVGSLMGAGVGTLYHCIKCSGTSSNIVVSGNSISGSYDTKNIVLMSAVTGASVVGNNLTATSGTGAAIVFNSSSTGTAAPNSFTGFTTKVTADSLTAVGYNITGIQVPTYGATINTDAALGDTSLVIVTNTTPFTMAAPSNPSDGRTLNILVINTSGGVMGTITWNAIFKLNAFTNPATGYMQSITFTYSSGLGKWYEISRTATQVLL